MAEELIRIHPEARDRTRKNFALNFLASRQCLFEKHPNFFLTIFLLHTARFGEIAAQAHILPAAFFPFLPLRPHAVPLYARSLQVRSLPPPIPIRGLCTNEDFSKTIYFSTRRRRREPTPSFPSSRLEERRRIMAEQARGKGGNGI